MREMIGKRYGRGWFLLALHTPGDYYTATAPSLQTRALRAALSILRASCLERGIVRHCR
jgi:hypothetical protein